MRVLRVSLGVLLLLWLAPAFPVAAETITLLGRIGEFPVAVQLEKKGERLDGWYFYVSRARQIRLAGSLKGDVFHLDETAAGSVSGVLDGSVKEGVWSGSWRKSSAASPLAVELEVSAKQLAVDSAHYRCTTREHERSDPYTYVSTLQLMLTSGKVKQLRAEQTASANGQEDQACAIELDDLEQMPSASGLLLRAPSDRPAAKDRHCTIRLHGNARFLWLSFGDSARDGDDCRSADDTMFCSPRAMWRDVVVDRQTQKCKVLN